MAPSKWVEIHGRGKDPYNLEVAEVPDTWSQLRKKSWARILKNIFEVYPFLCLKCGGTVAVVTVIEDRKELEDIFQWAGQGGAFYLEKSRLTRIFFPGVILPNLTAKGWCGMILEEFP